MTSSIVSEAPSDAYEILMLSLEHARPVRGGSKIPE